MFEHLQKTCHLIVITAAKPRGRLVRFLIAAERPHSCLCTSVNPDSPQKLGSVNENGLWSNASTENKAKKEKKSRLWKSSGVDCFDVRSGDWRIGAACRSMSGMFALEEDISDLHRSPCRSLLCLCGLCSVMKYSQQATLTPLKAAAKSVSVSQRRKSSHYARTAIVLRISSIGEGGGGGRGVWAPLISIHSRLLPASVLQSSFKGRLETTGVFSLRVCLRKGKAATLLWEND